MTARERRGALARALPAAPACPLHCTGASQCREFQLSVQRSPTLALSSRRAQAGRVWWPLAWRSVWSPWSRSSWLVWSARHFRFSCPRATRACWGCSTQLRLVCFWQRHLSTCWCVHACPVEGQKLQPLVSAPVRCTGRCRRQRRVAALVRDGRSAICVSLGACLGGALLPLPLISSCQTEKYLW